MSSFRVQDLPPNPRHKLKVITLSQEKTGFLERLRSSQGYTAQETLQLEPKPTHGCLSPKPPDTTGLSSGLRVQRAKSRADKSGVLASGADGLGVLFEVHGDLERCKRTS